MSSIYYTLSRSLHLTTISNLPIHHSIFPLSPTTSTPNFVSTPPQTSSSPVTNSTPDPTRRPSIHPQHLNEADSTVLYFMISIASYRIHPIAKEHLEKRKLRKLVIRSSSHSDNEREKYPAKAMPYRWLIKETPRVKKRKNELITRK